MTRKTVLMALVGLLLVVPACDSSFMAGFTGFVFSADPLIEVLGGDDDRLFYSVQRGMSGTVEVYEYDLVANERLLIGSGPPGLLSRVATDGRYLAFTRTQLLPFPNTLVVSDLETGNERVILEGGLQDPVHQFALENAGVAYVVGIWGEEGDYMNRLIVEDLESGQPPVRQFDFDARLIHQLHLCGDYLAFTVSTPPDSGTRILLHNLGTGQTTTVASDVSHDIDSVFISLTEDTVAWGAYHRDVMAYDILTGETRLWVEGAGEAFADATRDYLLLAEGRWAFLKGADERVRLRCYDANGNSRTLAEHRARWFGRSIEIVGNRAVWINEATQIVMEPLAGGEQRVIDPL